MAARKRHVQQALVFVRWGGARRGAGRKRQGPRKRVAHRRRLEVNPRHPQHVTLRVLECVGRMRRREAYHAVREALLVVAPREDFRVVHLSIQGNHIHLICEAASRVALSSGIRALKISAARRLNSKLGREGAVFSDRYHVEPLGTPRQVRNCISYVINNWRRHDEDRHAAWPIDLYSSAISFSGFQERISIDVPSTYLPLPVSKPQTWLLAVGWRKSKPISCRERPGPLRNPN